MFLVDVFLQFFHFNLYVIHPIVEVILVWTVKRFIIYQSFSFLQDIISLGFHVFQLQQYFLIQNNENKLSKARMRER